MGNPTQTSAWKKLQTQSASLQSYDRKIITHGGITLNLTRTMIGDAVWQDLFDLATEQDVTGWRNKMANGDAINTTEHRAVGHMALRSGNHADAESVLKKMQTFCDKIHAANEFTDIVHIGIGGSDLGPRLVYDALKSLPKKMNVHFVSNVDAADITETLKPLSPRTTLFIIASKTFTTQETMMNANFAKAWLGDLPIKDHMIALSTNAAAVTAYGINPDNMFPFWDWVGGRYSVWSAIGIPIALGYGFDVFRDFLSGAKNMDEHFMTAPLHDNLPILLALFGIWNRNFMNRPAVAILPYAQNLQLFVDYLQQLDMESNGKSVDRNGDFITDYQTGPIVFGQVGTNGQHSFHQWLHQATDIVPCEIIQCASSPYNAAHHRVLNAHATAQAQAFQEGRTDNTNHHRHYQGNRPSVTLEIEMISPHVMGQMMALYEHKVFTQGIIWNINSFDQYGVELGKELAQRLLA